METKQYRHELKFIINKNQSDILKYRLGLIMDIDTNSSNEDNSYYIRSLYFDDIYDTAYYEKIDGIEKREKYRIRIYNFDDKFIRLERKEKNRDLTHKEQEKISKRVCVKLMNKDFSFVDYNNRSLLRDFSIKYKNKELRPSVIVDYRRTAYTYPVEDVRITFDEDIKSGRFNNNLFDKKILLFDTMENDEVVLEVKYNNYIPIHLAKIIETIPSVRQAISKFALCKEKKEV